MDEEVRKLERFALLGDEAAVARLARARKLSWIETLERAMDPSWKARERREAADRDQLADEIEFCRRAVNNGIVQNLYRGRHGCWCQMIMALRRLEGLPEFEPKEHGDRWGMFDAELRGRRRG